MPRQIVAIARVSGATTIYSDDEGIAAFGKEIGITVIKLKDLPLPPEKLQIEMFSADGDVVASEKAPHKA